MLSVSVRREIKRIAGGAPVIEAGSAPAVSLLIPEPTPSALKKFASLARKYWALVLLAILTPGGLATACAKTNPIAVFFINFVAVIPSAHLNSQALHRIRALLGDIKGALIYMTFRYYLPTSR
jgi:cobalamin synthase